MKKNKSTKAKIRNLVRIAVILFLAMIVSIIFCRKEIKANDKILESTVHDAFVFQSILLAHHLEPNKPNSYTDIENLEDDSDSFVSDAAIKTGSSQYYIRVNYGANCVNIYTKDDNGNYTKPYKAMICSTGTATPTSGTYKISYKYRWLRLFGNVYGQYSTRIVKNILFHSVPYYEQRADTLEWDEYDKLGTTASAGCIRLTVQDAKWIYDNITSGTYVEFYSDKTNPGPLGKPTAQKISDNKKCRDWDPTDPDKNNPWNGGSGIPSVTYTAPKTTPKNNSNTNSHKNISTKPETTQSTIHNNTTIPSHNTETSKPSTTDDDTTTITQSNTSSNSNTTDISNTTSDKVETNTSKPSENISVEKDKDNNSNNNTIPSQSTTQETNTSKPNNNSSSDESTETSSSSSNSTAAQTPETPPNTTDVTETPDTTDDVN